MNDTLAGVEGNVVLGTHGLPRADVEIEGFGRSATVYI